MGGRNFSYFIREGIFNMFSHGFMTFASIGITVACLLITGTFTLLAVNANHLLHDLERENEILVYVDDALSQEQARGLQKDLSAVPNIASIQFISKQEALASFVSQYPDEEMFQDLDPEILRDRYAIKLVNLKQQAETADMIRQIPGVADVNDYAEIASGFVTIRNVTSLICITLIVILFIVSVFIISNTIKLTTFERREEIAVMRMVGATNSFIRWPFVYEGLFIGSLGAVIAFLFQWALYAAVAHGIGSNDTLQIIEIIPFEQLWIPVAAVFACAGLIIGIGGGLSAIRKFLHI